MNSEIVKEVGKLASHLRMIDDACSRARDSLGTQVDPDQPNIAYIQIQVVRCNAYTIRAVETLNVILEMQKKLVVPGEGSDKEQ